MKPGASAGLPKLLVAALCAAAISAPTIPQTAWAASAGIRHRVTAKLLPFSNPVGVSRSAPASSSRADLRIFMQISDHAVDSRFYGTAEARFADVDPSIGADEAVVWEDARCHRERGIPKISLVRIDGAIRSGDKTTPLTAVGRQIGLRVPADEIVERKGVADDDAQTLMIIDASTKASGIAVRIRLTGERCAL